MTTNFATAAAVPNAPMTAKKFESNGVEGDRPRRPNPHKLAFDKKMDDITRKIKSLEGRVEQLRSDDSSHFEGTKEAKAARAKLLERKSALLNQKRQSDEERKQLEEELNGLKDSQKRQIEQAQAAKDKLPYRNVEQIERMIKEKEQQIEQGGLSLKDEKNTLQDISKLIRNKKALESLECNKASAVDPVAALKLKYEVTKGRIDDKYTESKKIKSELNTVFEELKAFEGDKVEAANRRKRAEEEISGLRKQIDALYDEKRKHFEENKKDQAARQEAYARNQVKREEMAKRIEVEDKIDDAKKRLRKIDPSTAADRKLNECVHLASYFGQFAESHGDAKVATSEPSPAARKPEALPSDEWDVITPKSDRNEVYYKSGKSAKKTGSASASKSDSLAKLPLHILAGLADLGYAVPKNPQEAKDLVVQLGRRREEIEEQRNKALESVRGKQKVIEEEIEELKKQLATFTLTASKYNKYEDDEDEGEK